MMALSVGDVRQDSEHDGWNRVTSLWTIGTSFHPAGATAGAARQLRIADRPGKER
jgi:hypothetical protein